jgi:predicted deacylase
MPVSQPPWHHAEPGTRSAFSLPVAARADGSHVSLPVIVVRGARPGKTLVVTAGVHGDEFEGMAAIRRTAATLDPQQLAGTFVGVPVANPPAYEAGLRTNPDDGQDMARAFPGDPSGSITEQLAHALSHSFLPHAAFYCDLHSAGQYYTMPPLVGYQLRPEPLWTAQRQAAHIFGLPIVWGTPVLPGRSLSAAGDAGVPALYAEITGEGRCRAEDVERYAHGLHQLLRWLGIIAEPPHPHEPEWVIEDDRPQAGFLQVQNRAQSGGFFQAEVAPWEEVEPGQCLGTIRDPLGEVRHVVQAAHAGRVVFLRTFPRVLAGDPVCTVLEMDRTRRRERDG